MEITERTSLIQPRPSPKMDRIFAALQEGWPKANINDGMAKQYVLWGLIGENPRIMQSDPYIFCDMPYNGRYNPKNEDWDNTFWRWCFNSLHDHRRLNVPADRFLAWENYEVKPWDTSGEHILICPSSQTMTHYMTGKTVEQWVQEVVDYVSEQTNRPIKLRLKPRRNGTSGPAARPKRSIEEDLENAYCVITEGSLTSIDALKAGVPVISTNKKFAPSAWCSNSLHQINNIKLYDREQLFYNLAYKQYSIKEMREGICYENSKLYLVN
jgi:hypothetical protein